MLTQTTFHELEIIMLPWNCPFCHRPTTMTQSDLGSVKFDLQHLHKNYSYSNKRTVFLELIALKCPNPECKETELRVKMYNAKFNQYNELIENSFEVQKVWELAPEANIKSYPNYIPQALIVDYEEASKILHLSPKASATLSRRCLQGMIRDYWKISKSRLKDEIDALEDLIDPTTWEAIDAIRRIGNIGAHMEKDINVIIDVDENEAETLIHLIEILFEEWYINKYEREQKKLKVLAIATSKVQSKV